MIGLNLNKDSGRFLEPTKLKSLARKYFSIPAKYLWYYPEGLEKLAQELEPEDTLITKKKRAVPDMRASAKSKKKRKVGRPKKIPIYDGTTPSILTFFNKV